MLILYLREQWMTKKVHSERACKESRTQRPPTREGNRTEESSYRVNRISVDQELL